MTWRSTSCIALALPLRFQCAHNRLRLALRPPLSIEPHTERVDDGRQVCQQILCAVLSLIDHFECTPLVCEQGIELAEAEARQAVLVLAPNHAAALTVA